MNGTISITDGRIYVELYGHAYAPDHLIDGTVHHPGAVSLVKKAADGVGSAAESGATVKRKRYPTKFGKAILPCSMETWGYIGKSFEGLLEELQGLAGRRQRDKGMVPTKWLLKWRTQLSLAVVLHTSRAIIGAIPKEPCDRREPLWRDGFNSLADGGLRIEASPFDRDIG